MFDYSPINTYPCTPPGVATNKKKITVNCLCSYCSHRSNCSDCSGCSDSSCTAEIKSDLTHSLSDKVT